MATRGDRFHPGEAVPNSGIYAVVHDGHREPHEVTCIKGRRFPPCRDCGHGAAFVLRRKAKHVERHRDFATP